MFFKLIVFLLLFSLSQCFSLFAFLSQYFPTQGEFSFLLHTVASCLLGILEFLSVLGTLQYK